MNNKDQAAAAELRERAEAALRERAARSAEHIDALTPEATQRLLLELQVHRIELEMQNDELRCSQAKLDTSNARYFDFYDLAPVGYVSVSKWGLILQVNLTTATLLGVARCALIKKPISRFILKEDQDSYYLLRKRIIATGEPQSCEVRLVQHGGAQFWARLDAIAAQDAEGAPILLIVLGDITRRKQAEESSRTSMALLDAVVSGTTDAIYVKDLNGRYTLVNKAAASYVGRTAEEVLGKDDYFLFPAEEAKNIVKNDRAIIEGRSALTHEEALTLADGRVEYFLSTKGPIFDTDGRKAGVFGITRNITERKRAEEMLLNMAAGLENTVSARTLELRALSARLTLTEERERQMLAQELHDNLSQLLAAIKIKLCLLKADMLQTSVDQIVELVDEADRSTRTITQQLSPTNLRELGFMPALERLVEEMQSIYGLTVHLDNDAGSTPLACIPEALQAVLYRSARELLINVAKHARASEGSLSCLCDSDRQMLVVSDDGCGFDPADSDLAPLTGKRSLGLRSIRERMLSLGGEMEIDSSPGNGTTITLAVPCSMASGEPRAS